MINREFYLSYPSDIIIKILNVIKTVEKKDENELWRRTRCNIGSGTNYGPYQITGEVVKRLSDSYAYTLVAYQLLSYVRLFIAQSELFIQHGNKEHIQFYNVDYDYGGKGHLYEEIYQEEYEEMARLLMAVKMMEINYIVGDDVSQVFSSWYGSKNHEQIKLCVKLFNES